MAATGSGVSCQHLNSEQTRPGNFKYPFNLPAMKLNKMARKHSCAATMKKSPSAVSTRSYNLRLNANDKENRGLKKFPSLSASVTNLNVKQLKTEANKTMQTFKTTIDSFSQRFRRSTRRRYRLDSGTASSPTNTLEEQSPVKLYSPFRIDTPPRLSTRMGTPGRYTPKRCLGDFASPSRTFHRDVEALTRGSQQLNDMAAGITSRKQL